MDEKHKKLSIIGFAILLVALLGGTYAFFNYTRTGTANNIRTGRIYFNTTQGEELNLTNVFPMKSSEAESANLDSVTVGIVGDTTYADGEEFEITLTGLNNTVNGKEIPINYIATYTAATGGSIGESSDTYFTARESKDANIYKLNATGKVLDGKQVLTGYIKNGTTGISGTLTIKAYIDADRIAISDTYYENAPTPRPTAPSDEYGTTTEWVDGRVVFTTEEWNSLSTNGISFKIKAESNEGIWVVEPGSIPSCLGCKYIYPESHIYTTWTTSIVDLDNNTVATPTVLTTGYYDKYEELITATGYNYFIGVKLDSDNHVTNIYACGEKNDTPFCIEATSDGSKYNRNNVLLQSSALWNNTCTTSVENQGTSNELESTSCSNSGSKALIVNNTATGFVSISNNDDSSVDYGYYCFASNTGDAYCGYD